MSCVAFSVDSALAVTPEAFWSEVSLSSVNAELAPLVRMTAPREWREVPLETWPTDQPLFSSVILLFGIVPVDVHHFRLESVDPRRGFQERSSSWLNSVWLHRRTIRPCAGGCVVADRVTVQAKVPFLERLLLPIYRAVFRHRHRRLRAIHGEATP